MLKELNLLQVRLFLFYNHIRVFINGEEIEQLLQETKKMNVKIREYTTEDAKAASEIWNQVVEDGVAFPQEDTLAEETFVVDISEKNWFLTVSGWQKKKASV